MSIQQHSKNVLKEVPKMIQQSKWLAGGPIIRKFNGGWGIYLHAEVNMLWGGFSWHTFANLGILPPHDILQSTQYFCLCACRDECNNKNRIGAYAMCKKWNQIQTTWLVYDTLAKLGGIGCIRDKIK